MGDIVDDKLYSVPIDADLPIPEEERKLAFRDALSKEVSELRAAGKRVIVVTSLPAPGFDVPDVLARKLWRDGQLQVEMSIPARAFREHVASALQVLNEACSAADAECVDFSDAVCDAAVCLAVNGGKPRYFDANHLSLEGAARLVAPLSQLLMSGENVGS